MNKEDLFDGAWKLNSEKSRFSTKHQPASATMQWHRTAEGYQMTAEGAMSDGNIVEERPTTFIFDGEDHEVPDVPGFTAAMSRPIPNTIEVESKKFGRLVGKASYVISEDGATLTASVTSIDGQERKVQNVLVWDRLSRWRNLRSSASNHRRHSCLTEFSMSWREK
jgi:hypothetical protein